MKQPLLVLFLLAMIVAGLPALAESETQQPDTAQAIVGVAEPHPSLFRDFKIEGYEYLEASLAVEDKGASISWAPFLPKGRYGFWSETRFQLKQKDDETAVGASIRWNPFHPRSKRGGKAWSAMPIESPNRAGLSSARQMRVNQARDELFVALVGAKTRPCDKTQSELEALMALVLPKMADADKPTVRQQAPCALVALRDEIADYEEGVKPSEEQQLRQRAYAALLAAVEALHFEDRRRPGAESDRDPIVERIKVLEAEIDTARVVQLKTEIATLEAEIKAARAATDVKNYVEFRNRLHSTAKPVLALSYSGSFFKVLGGGDLDADMDALNDNEHRTRSRAITLTADWRPLDATSFSVLLGKSTERPSAEDGTPTADYDAYGLTWMQRLKILNRDGYRKTKDFKESLFVPSIVFGLGYEQKDCDSPDADCADGILRSTAVTPFVDFKITKKAQFRIGIPLRRDRIFVPAGEPEEADSIEVVSLVALQLGAPK